MDWWRRRTPEDFEDEVRAHVEAEEARLRECGVALEEARRRARAAFGGMTQARERFRGRSWWRWFEPLWQDIRYALRGMRRDPRFSVSTVLILALGIGLATGLLGVANGLYLRGWRVPDSRDVFRVEAVFAPSEGRVDDGVSLAAYRHLAANARHADYVAYGYSAMRAGSQREDRPAGSVLVGLFVSDNFFRALRIPLAMGTAPLPEAQSPMPTVVISHRVWQTVFAGTSDILGRTVWLDGQPTVAVGVAAPGFPGLDRPVGVYVPMWATDVVHARGDFIRRSIADPDACCVTVAGRLTPGSSWPTLAPELQGLVGQYRTSLGKTPLSLHVSDTALGNLVLGRNRLGQVLALVAVGIVALLLLASANVGNLHLARGLRRQHEIATRLALGASRARLVRQLLTEGVALASVAGVLGYAAAASVPLLMAWIGAADEPLAFVVGVDWRVALGTALIVVIVCVIVSLAPALRVTGLVWRGGTATARTGGLRGALLAVQVTIATVLILSATLISRGILFGVSAPTDFALTSTTAAILDWPDEARTRTHMETVRRDLQAALDTSGLPIGLATQAPVSPRAGFITGVRVPDTRVEFRTRLFPIDAAGADVLDLRVKAGRWASDDRNAFEGVVNETLARRVWGNASPLGRKLRLDFDRTVYTIVGVVADAHILSPGEVPAILHVPPPDILSVVLLFTASPAAEASIQSLLKGIAPSMSVRFVPLTDSIRETMSQAVDGALIAGSLGLLALILAMTGVYAVFTYVVEERRREIGIRLALGARRSHVRRTMFAATYNALVAGLAGGLALSLIAGMLLRRFLFGMLSVDPISYAIVGGCLVCAALLATYVPIERALRCNPGATLKRLS